jgi:hypothetical protein
MDENADAYRLAYEEAVRALSRQEEALENFRTRAGLLLSAAAITTSFLGAQALSAGHPGPTAWLALAAFAGLGGAVLAMLLPGREEYAADSKLVVAVYIEGTYPYSLTQIHRDLAIHMETSIETNQIALKRLAGTIPRGLWSHGRRGDPVDHRACLDPVTSTNGILQSKTQVRDSRPKTSREKPDEAANPSSRRMGLAQRLA